jgi:hypothetical protein
MDNKCLPDEVPLRTNNIGTTIQNITNLLPVDITHKIKKGLYKVIDVNPFHNQFCNIAKGVTTNSTGGMVVYTTPTDVDFYLTNVTLSMQKDATCDLATSAVPITTTINKVSTTLAYIPTITLTASTNILTLVFPTPVKIDRNVSISNTATFTVGVLVRGISIQGFTYDPKVYNTAEN